LLAIAVDTPEARLQVKRFQFFSTLAAYDNPSGNLTGGPWFSDGYRIVLWVSSEPVSIDDVDFLEWRSPH
jgi:hypothetical protein